MDAKDYYTYQVAPGESWWVKTPPKRNLLFERELELLAGVNTFGNPILRVSWGGTLKSDVAAKDTLKYKKIWKGLTGFTYSIGNVTQTILPNIEIPKGAIVAPVYSEIELGKLRWIIEKWQSIEDAIRGGRFNPEALGSDGKPLFREPPREGVYNAFIEIESADGRFRDLDDAVLEEIKRQWDWNENTPLDQKVADLLEDEKREARAMSGSANSVWQG